MISLKDWKTMSLESLTQKYQISIQEIYDLSNKQRLYKYDSPIERRSMGILEKDFIKNNQNLSVTQLSNILHKSYNATLIQVKTLGFYNIIRK